ncbi:MAG TPA: hypothetical protein DCQ83_05485 [Fibrobacteres bacterium]|nr:hypothetical protein [Fibrobacterota bacterium]
MQMTVADMPPIGGPHRRGARAKFSFNLFIESIHLTKGSNRHGKIRSELGKGVLLEPVSHTARHGIAKVLGIFPGKHSDAAGLLKKSLDHILCDRIAGKPFDLNCGLRRAGDRMTGSLRKGKRIPIKKFERQDSQP